MSNENRDNGAIRIQKFLSLAGIASRRHAEELIEQGRVKVSGRVVTEMGVLVVPGKSRVEVDNKPVFLFRRAQLYFVPQAVELHHDAG